MAEIRNIYDRVLEAIAVTLIAAVTGIVTLGFLYRWAGFSLVWYDEVASISLCWLTYYGGALAALRGAHIGFSGFVNVLPTRWRVNPTLFASVATLFFFVVLAITGIEVVLILGRTTLVSLPAVSQRLTQSVIPIASVLFILAELIRLPDLVREARHGPLPDAEVKEALETVREIDELKAPLERKP